MFSIIKLTFYELKAKAIFIGMFLIATLIWVMLAFAMNMDVVNGSITAFRIFGNDVTGEGGGFSNLSNLVMNIQAFVAGASYWMGMLLAIFATGGLIPTFFESGRADLMLAKPKSRATLLWSRLLGIFLIVALLLFYLLGMVWLVMGIKTGVWNIAFLNAFWIILAMFIAMYSIATFVGITTGSSALGLMVTYALIFCSLIFTFPNLESLISSPYHQIYQALHFILPKFAEVTTIPTKLIAKDAVSEISNYEWQAFYGTLLFGGVLYSLSFWRLSRKDF